MKDYYIYYDNNFVKQSNATLSVLSASTQFGLNVFEGIRVYKEDFYYIFRLEDHLKRLNNSLQQIGFEVDVISKIEFLEILRELIILNNIKTDFSIRFTYLINEIDSWSSKRQPVFFIAPLIRDRNTVNLYKTMVLTETRRISSYAMNTKVKCGANYINGRYALLEANSKGADFPILKNKDGFISESSGACIFLVKNGVITTPSLDCDILESITRDTVLKIFLKHKFNTEERLITEEELYESDEIFLCGTAAEITPIRSVDRIIIGNGKRGAMTSELQNKFFGLFSEDTKNYDHWLESV